MIASESELADSEDEGEVLRLGDEVNETSEGVMSRCEGLERIRQQFDTWNMVIFTERTTDGHTSSSSIETSWSLASRDRPPLLLFLRP